MNVKQTVSFELQREQAARLREVARQEDRSMSAIIRRAVARELERVEGNP